MTTLRERLFGCSLSKTFDINSIKVTMKALSEKDNTEVWSRISSSAPVSAVRVPVLARAILFIEGKRWKDLDDVTHYATQPPTSIPLTEAQIYEAAEKYLQDQFTVSEIDYLYDLYSTLYIEDRKRIEDLKKA